MFITYGKPHKKPSNYINISTHQRIKLVAFGMHLYQIHEVRDLTCRVYKTKEIVFRKYYQLSVMTPDKPVISVRPFKRNSIYENFHDNVLSFGKRLGYQVFLMIFDQLHFAKYARIRVFFDLNSPA